MPMISTKYGLIMDTSEQFFYKIPVDFWKIHVGEVVAPWLPIGLGLGLGC